MTPSKPTKELAEDTGRWASLALDVLTRTQEEETPQGWFDIAQTLSVALLDSLKREEQATAEAGVLLEAAIGIDTFAWSAMHADCTDASIECMERIRVVREAIRNAPLATALLKRLAEAETDVSEHERDMKNMARDHLDSEVSYRATIRDLTQRLAAAEAKAGWRPTREQIARALYQGMEQNGGQCWDGLDKFNRGLYYDQADAILALAPTEQTEGKEDGT